MRNLIALVVVSILYTSSTVAVAEPTAAELTQRKTDLEKKLRGQGFHVVVQAPFVVVSDDRPAVAKKYINFVKWTTDLIEKDFFKKRPDKLIEIWLFSNERTYRRGAKKFFDDTPTTPYGYYSPEDNALIMNIGPGAGTLSHELVHPYMEVNFPKNPSWFNEGLASLFEQPREKDGHMTGGTNWRLPGLQAHIRKQTLPPIAELLKTTRDGFYEASYDSYAYARFLCQYLQDHGKLREFYAKFSVETKDLTGATTLAAVVGMDLAKFDVVFQKWAMTLRR